MISFFVTVLLSVFVLCAIVLKLIKVRLSRTTDILVCAVIPIFCLIAFVALFFETSFRRKAEIKELNMLIESVSYDIMCNRAFVNNEDKEACKDSLALYLQHVQALAREDTLVSIIAGRNEEMTQRILDCSKALEEQIKWINRLNPIIEKSSNYSSVEPNCPYISLIGPSTDELPVLKIAYHVKMETDEIEYAHVEVLRENDIYYRNNYLYNTKMNCLSVPYNKVEHDTVRIGYVTKQNVFKYIIYAGK